MKTVVYFKQFNNMSVIQRRDNFEDYRYVTYLHDCFHFHTNSSTLDNTMQCIHEIIDIEAGLMKLTNYEDIIEKEKKSSLEKYYYVKNGDSIDIYNQDEEIVCSLDLEEPEVDVVEDALLELMEVGILPLDFFEKLDKFKRNERG